MKKIANTSGIDWIDSTKLSSDASQMASFTTLEKSIKMYYYLHFVLSQNKIFKFLLSNA